MQPALTIITPVHNGEQRIEACLNNVIDQHCPDVEHIVVDRNSTDNTKKLAGAIAFKHANIMITSVESTGLAEAMNHGVELANAPVIGLLRVDDFYTSGALKKVLKHVKNLPEPSLIVGNCNVLDGYDRVTGINKPNRLKITDLLAGRIFPYNSSAYFYHKSLHDATGLYDVQETQAVDLDFILRAVQKAHTHYIDEIWGNYRFIKNEPFESDETRRETLLSYENVRKKYRKKASPLQRISIKSKKMKDQKARAAEQQENPQ